MRVIGLLGGIASGKSFVAAELVRLGAGLLDADRAGHEVLRLPHVEVAINERFGGGVFGCDGHVDRSRLAEIVFAGGPEADEARKHLEQLTHPEIATLLKQQAEALRATGTTVAVLDAPLLLESGWHTLCERLVFVDAPREVRAERALARGWTREDFAAREAVQNTLDSKRAIADVKIGNSGSPEETQAQIERFWRSLTN